MSPRAGAVARLRGCALPGHQLVTDAGGNSLLDVRADGSISTVTTFPKVIGGFGPADPVPTEVVLGPDGAYYVSTLTGIPFTPGAAVIFRVVPGVGEVLRIEP